MTVKQSIGRVLFRTMPVSRHVFDHFRLELNAFWVRLLHRTSPRYRARIRDLRRRRDLLVNLGCGPFGRATGWVNLDLAPIEHGYMRTDCRRWLPMADSSCLGVHVEMFLEHLDPVDEVPGFLQEIRRCLQENGVARFVVPDASLFIRAYLSSGWEAMNKISYGSEDWARLYPSKMDALNHVFQQGYEHHGGWDLERLEWVLHAAGFSYVERRAFGAGEFPGGPIDREYHRANGLYVEARK